MSVIKQRLATISGDMKNLEAAALYCSFFDNFYPDDPPRSVNEYKRVIPLSDINPYTPLKNKSSVLLDNIQKKLLTQDKNVTEYQMKVFTELKQYSDFIEEKEKKLAELNTVSEVYQKQLSENKMIIEQLGHLKSIEVPLRELYEFEYVKIRFGYLPRENFDRFEVYISSIKSAIFLPSSIEKDSVWGMYFTLRDTSVENDNVFTTLGFKRVRLPDKADETPAESIHEIQVEMAQLQKKYNETQQQIYDYSKSIYSDLYEVNQYLLMTSKSFDLKKKVLIIDENTFRFYGWISSSSLKKLEARLKSIDVSLIIDEFDISETTGPPVVLKNNSFVRPFQDFVEMYGLPAYNEFDPTPFVAITFALFFGMMFGDVGQGATLIIVGFLIKKFLKMDLGNIISIVGVFSIGFGFVYGSVFGYEGWIKGFKPLENSNTILLFAVGIGIIMITVCSIFNILNGIKQKRIDKYLLSPNGVVGLIFYWSMLIFIINLTGIIKINIPLIIIQITLIISALLLFSRELIMKKIKGHKEDEKENIAELLVTNFFELFEVCLSYVTNTISFIRIGAFALSHASMMQVVFMLAEQSKSGYIITIIFGNIIVMVLEGLVVGIQVLRLEFYELFSRFYEGDGRSAAE